MADSINQNEAAKPLFRDITADDETPEITSIESLCVNCEEQGITRLLLTRIPFFREVIVMSFTCDHCGYRNAELEPGGKVQDQGVTYRVTVTKKEDLNRQVVQTASATVKIPSLELEIPPNKGALTTIEGIIERTKEGLEQGQVLRRIQYPDVAAKIDDFLLKLTKLKEVETPFDLILDDPSGNSFLENPSAPNRDPDLHVSHYSRTREQNEQLGLMNPDHADAQDGEEEQRQDGIPAGDAEGKPKKDEVLNFQTNCPNCTSPCETHMKLVNIPHFKEVVIMATNCDACGHRENEVKSSGGIEEKGKRIKLRITDPSDMNRDVLKSETCSIMIPELKFETDMGTLGGKFTTIEGLLTDIKTQLRDGNPFFHGDSSQPDLVTKLSKFCDQLDKIISGELLNIHLILDDPAGNSYMQNTYAPEDDPEMEIEDYERSFEQREELGLNDMKTENYETS